ncbi:hypothetical protein GCM10009682_23940 [Luedemannella flava]|uniref:DUF3893 domain-containing protein n=1 Tax=Luedemannella flava TaxID=349316 RepID=A0ABN2LWF2_9ACTN
MPRYDHLAVTTLRLDPSVAMPRVYHQLRFPGVWKDPLRRLAQAARGGSVASIPIQSLNDAITALVPDCVVTMTRATQGNDDQDWLLTYRKIDTRALFSIVAGWVRAQKAGPNQIAATLTQLDPADLDRQWSQLNVDLAAVQHRDLAFRLLPMEIAATLSQPDVVCGHGDLRFRRCATDTGAELISWPPLAIEEETPYSVKIGITTQTIPTSSELFVYMTFGVRRWVPVRAKLAFDHGHNVYLAPTLPYVTGLANSRHFGRARIRLTRSSAADGNTSYGPQWDDALARVLHQVGCLSRLPDPQQLTDKPMDYLQREGDAAALVYSPGMLGRRKEKVSAGLSPADREPLITWVTETLTPHLHLLEPQLRVPASVYPQLRRATNVNEQATTFPAQICSVIGQRLDIDLFTDTAPSTTYALTALAARLGVNLPTADQLTDTGIMVDCGALTLGLRRSSSPGITADLDRDAPGAGKKLQDAVQARVTHIEATVPRAKVPTIALVEIAGPDSYSGARRGHDPIFAIRQGLLRTDRLTQFITPVVEPTKPPRIREGREPSDPNLERFISAVDDLFRQLGVRPAPLPRPFANTLQQQPALLAFWVIRQNKGRTWGVRRQVPIAVLIDPTGQDVRICAPQIDWQPLHTGLLEIGRRYVNVDLNMGPDEITRFVKETIAAVVGAYPDVLMLTHAQNLRSEWKFVSNSQVKLDLLGFGADNPQPIAKYPGLRHIRVRTAEAGETPECFGFSTSEPGQPLGLWRYVFDRVYGSTGSKPMSASNAIKSVSKIAPYEHKDEMRAPKASAHVWNQQFIELFVAAIQPGDVPDHWAALAHDLRWAAPYSDVTTTLPWPLHLAKQVDEYLLPAKINGMSVVDQLDEP